MDRRAAALPGMSFRTDAARRFRRLACSRALAAGQNRVVCGPGNNGGDGYVLARLARADGWQVEVVASSGQPAPPMGGALRREWREAGGATRIFDGLLPVADVWVDALFGIGLDLARRGHAQALIEQINHSGRPVLALDVPSGVVADTGRIPGLGSAPPSP